MVVGLGELLWDTSPTGRRWGGAPANFACHAAQLGADAWTVSAVGDDDDGRALLRAASAHGVQACVAALPDRPTGRVDVAIDPSGVPSYRIAAHSAWDHIPWSDEVAALAARADAVCFGSLAQRHPDSRATIHRFLDTAPPRALRIFDANLRAPFDDHQVMLDSLGLADALKVNDEEWSQLTQWLDLDDRFDAACRTLCERFALRAVVRTNGARGSDAYVAGRARTAPAAAVDAVDTVGAGDAFTAVCCLGLLRGADPEALLSLAGEVAGFVCTQPGGTPALDADLGERARRQLALQP